MENLELGVTNEIEYFDADALKNIKSYKDIPSYNTNPFTRDFIYSKRKYYDKAFGATIKAGDVTVTNKFLEKEGLVLAEKLYRDNTPFCRVFTDHDIFKVADLNPGTCKLLLYLCINNTNLNIDYVSINIKTYSEILGMSMNTIYSCITELARNKILLKSKTNDGLYWVNPHIFFKGDRKKIKFRKLN